MDDWSIDSCSKLASNRFSEDLLGVSSEDVYTDLGTRQSTEDETGETCRSVLQHVLPKLFSLEEPIEDRVMDTAMYECAYRVALQKYKQDGQF